MKPRTINMLPEMAVLPGKIPGRNNRILIESEDGHKTITLEQLLEYIKDEAIKQGLTVEIARGKILFLKGKLNENKKI